MIGRILAWLMYREPYVVDNRPYRYYSIGACLIFLIGLMSFGVAVAAFVAFVLYAPK